MVVLSFMVYEFSGIIVWFIVRFLLVSECR